MSGGIVMTLILLVVFPVLVCMSGAIIAAVIGFFLKKNGEETHEGSELIDLNV